MLVVLDSAGLVVDLLIKCPVFLPESAQLPLLLDDGLPILLRGFLSLLKRDLRAGSPGLLGLGLLESFLGLLEFQCPELIVLREHLVQLAVLGALGLVLHYFQLVVFPHVFDFGVEVFVVLFGKFEGRLYGLYLAV